MILKNSIPFVFLALFFVVPSQEPFVQTGMASYYADKFHNRPTSSGEKYDKNAFTAAHKTLPFGTIILVTNLKNDSTVLLKVNDRIPSPKRIIDVSMAGAKQLNFIREGLAHVKIETIEPEKEMTDKVEFVKRETIISNEMSESAMEGKSLMDKNCISCHKMKPVNNYTLAKWDIILPKMAKKAKISVEEQEKIRTFVVWKLEN
jgi:rare lipoprotein A